MAPTTGDRDALVVRARLDPREIGYLNMLVESYEGLAIVRTADRGAGVVEFWVTPSRLAEFDEALVALRAELGLVELGRAPWTTDAAP